ncbi:hypothetical protein [Flagellimonas allohymeniacidonis]|uniref:Glycosyltransferase n=1 Tax=Flagellimonas allohymeniacidonis TaxID=2517819 RepID=A0A4Q8QB26_9FLAO|nr:hypothetical protein [Allomuricauda hymeniacidonis]TAI47542.1 hypothetical protein EW142_12805 [Allomuricauda hymeniacidonis]
MKSKSIFCESRIDYKYENVFSRLDGINTIEGTYLHLLKQLLKSKDSRYHIRYISYRGKILTPLRILVIFFVCKLTGSRILWSCHNIYEHNVPSKRENDFLRFILCRVSNKIVVFHEDIKKELPKWAKKKIFVACFGNYRSFIENQNEPNEEFLKGYQEWLKANNKTNPDIISVSAAKRNNLKPLILGVQEKKLSTLIIAPNRKNQILKGQYKNIFFFSGFVRKELKTILNTREKIIGYIGHDNMSVPTSIYMYASYGIPILCLDHKPLNTIIHDYKIGVVVKDSSSIGECYQNIQKNYDFYKTNCSHFLEKNSWDRSAEVHAKVFL